ncbi:MAG: hypothetical protein IJ858_09085 [Acidaminococcaceae bacterium]|nr:hypothetical protein [Acidaminococcaceae bacterium]
MHCGVTDNLCIDKVAQYKKNLQKQGHPVALVDAGDAIMEYVQNHLNAKIKDGYEDLYGTGRIKIR